MSGDVNVQSETKKQEETPVLLRSFHSHITELQILRVSKMYVK